MDLSEMVPERYRVIYISETNTFKLLDTWHPTIKNLNLEDNPSLPDDSPAIKILSSEEINALVGELIKIGWLNKLIESKTSPIIQTQKPAEKNIKELIVEKISEVTVHENSTNASYVTVVKDAISALKEIASKL